MVDLNSTIINSRKMSNSPKKRDRECLHARKHVYRFTAQSLPEQNMESAEVPACQQCLDCGAVLINVSSLVLTEQEYEGVAPK